MRAQLADAEQRLQQQQQQAQEAQPADAQPADAQPAVASQADDLETAQYKLYRRKLNEFGESFKASHGHRPSHSDLPARLQEVYANYMRLKGVLSARERACGQ